MTKTRRGRLLYLLWVVVPAATGFVAYRHRDALLRAWGLIGQVALPWLAASAAMIAGVYYARAQGYRVPLRVLRYTVRAPFLWGSAIVATSLHQLIPVGGASGYVFLTYALQQRGVKVGQASLIALLDTLSYAIAMATLVIGTLVYLIASGAMRASGFGRLVIPGVGVLVLAALLYVAQRKQARLERLVLRVKAWLERLVHREWSDEPIRRFLREYFEGKRLIARHPRSYVRMIAFQYLAVACDAGALYLIFVALGSVPGPWIVLMGLVVAMAGGAVLAVPAGGGGFEVIMSTFFTLHGVPEAQAIAATLLYRCVAFWLPVVTSVLVLLELRRRRPDIRRAR